LDFGKDCFIGLLYVVYPGFLIFWIYLLADITSVRPVIRKPGTRTLQITPLTDDNMAQVSTAFHFGLNTIFVILKEQHSTFIKQLNCMLQPWIKLCEY